MKKYIVTDPCYIVHNIAYRTIGEMLKWRWASVDVPVDLEREESEKNLTLLKVDNTPGGDGSCTYTHKNVDYQIGVDAGMLCVAFSDDGWDNESFGAKFETEGEAVTAWHEILANWNK